MRRKIVVLILWVAWIYRGDLYSDSISIDSKVSKTKASVSETILLTVNVTGSDFEPEVPKVKGIQVFPSGRSHSIMIINGEMSTTRSFTYMIQADDPGTYVIPAIKIKDQSQSYQSDPITIQFLDGARFVSSENPASKSDALSGEGEALPDIFSVSEVDKKEAVVGEQIRFTYKLYRRINLLGAPKYTPPPFENFWTEPLPPEKTYYQNIKGRRYVVSEINVALFPTQSGELTIGEAKLQCDVPSARSRRDPFSMFDDPDGFFGNDPFGAFSGEARLLKTKVITVKVSDLPSLPAFSKFCGAVGQFTFHADVDKKDVSVGSPITLSLSIEGQGNLQSIVSPDIFFGDQFKVYDSGDSLDIKTDGSSVHGKKEIKKVLIPLSGGVLKIPSISFVFYDPAQKSYQTLKSNPISLNVMGEAAKQEQVSQGNQSEPHESAAPQSKDIRFIKLKGAPFFDSMNRLSILSLFRSLWVPLDLLVLCALYRLWVYLFRSRTAGSSRSKKTLSIALKSLAVVRKKVKHQKASDIYEQCDKILKLYFESRLGSGIQGWTDKEVLKALGQKNVRQENLDRYRLLQEKIAFSRFSNVDIQKIDLKTLDDLADLLRELEEAL